MSNVNPKTSKFSFDWLLKGTLTKVGDTLDRLTGRNWKPSSSLATSEIIEKLKILLDAEAKDSAKGGRLVPHNIKLKMQWDKFSTDSEKAIEKLRNELHIAAIDHINEQRYFTYAPINVEITPDYFTEGVKILSSFEEFDEQKKEAEMNVTLPDLKVKDLILPVETDKQNSSERFELTYEQGGKQISKVLNFEPGDRQSIGRTKENNIVIDDISISKIHAALVLNTQRKLVLADTGSTNGTFINDSRIAYGRAFEVSHGDVMKFGTVKVELKFMVSEDAIKDVFIPDSTFDEFAVENSEQPSIGISNNEPGLSEVFGTSGVSDSLDFSDLESIVRDEGEGKTPVILSEVDSNEPH